MPNKHYYLLLLPFGIGLVVLALFLIVAQTIEQSEIQHLDDAVTREADNHLAQMLSRLERYESEIERTAQRLALFSHMNEADFLVDARLHMDEDESIAAVEWADAKDIIRWHYPKTQSSSFVIDMSLSWDETRYQTIREAIQIQDVLISPPIDLVEGGKGFMLAYPVLKNDQHTGTVMYLFKLGQFLNNLLKGDTFAASVYEDGVLLYQLGSNELASDIPPIQKRFTAYGANWRVELTPTASFAEKYHPQQLPLIIRWLGLFIAFIMGALTYLQIVRHQQDIKIRELNLFLEKKVEEKTSQLVEANAKLESKIEQERSENQEKERLLQQVQQQLEEIQKKDSIILEQSKMTALGDMISNIAHQWRQPLNLVSLVVSQVKLKIETKTEITHTDLNSVFERIEQQVQYLSGTIDDFRKFFAPSSDAKEMFSVGKAVKEALDITKASLEEHQIEIDSEYSSNTDVFGYPSECKQAFLNILKNAKDALLEQPDQRYLFVAVQDQGAQVLIEVIDNGKGIAKEHLPRIYEPYFTTKFQSKGTGIGLYMTYQIITEHMGGHIEASNASSLMIRGKSYAGARLSITLPKQAA